MCGIIGFTSARPCADFLLDGLEKLEYRGYDSAGVAVLDEAGALRVRKAVGRIATCAPPSVQAARRAQPASATRAGPRTASPAWKIRTRTSTRRDASPWCTTASSKITPS